MFHSGFDCSDSVCGINKLTKSAPGLSMRGKIADNLQHCPDLHLLTKLRDGRIKAAGADKRKGFRKVVLWNGRQ